MLKKIVLAVLFGTIGSAAFAGTASAHERDGGDRGWVRVDHDGDGRVVRGDGDGRFRGDRDGSFRGDRDDRRAWDRDGRGYVLDRDGDRLIPAYRR